MRSKMTKAHVPKKVKTKKQATNIFVLLRDVNSHSLLVAASKDVRVGPGDKISTGVEVSYTCSEVGAGRGIVLLQGSESECNELLTVLQKANTSSNDNDDDSRSIPLIDDSEQIDDDVESDCSDEQVGKKDENQVIATRNPQLSKSSITVSSVPTSSTPQNNKRVLSVINSSLNESMDHGSVAKRSKVDNSHDEYLRGRFLAVQDENRRLKEKITEMEATWMPRPDPVTINYFSTIVSICSGEEVENSQSKDEKLQKIMDTLAVSQSELDDCYDAKSIRNTCRRLFRLVFKDKVADINIRYSDILKNRNYKDQLAAVHEFGRVMHPGESSRFTKGELNNAMGSDFYQRDRNSRQQHNEATGKNYTADGTSNIEDIE